MRTNTAPMLSLSLALAGLCLTTAQVSAQGSMGSMGHDSASMGMGSQAAKSLHGSFTGVGGREAAGGYEIVTQNGRQVLRLSRDFSVIDEADATVVLSASSAVDAKSLTLGRLPHAMGVATFTIPAKTTLSGYHRVVIWSGRLGAALAEAPLGKDGGMMHDNMGR